MLTATVEIIITRSLTKELIALNISYRTNYIFRTLARTLLIII